MRSNLLAILLSGLLLSLPASATEYIDSLGDVPLMPGLTVHHEHTLVFDAPEGRVVEVTASGTDATLIIRFYGENLPALGWRALSPQLFQRDGETLELSLQQQDTGFIVVFSLKPH